VLCDPLGRPLEDAENISFAPFEVRFVRVITSLKRS